jgi:hypothetical protein
MLKLLVEVAVVLGEETAVVEEPLLVAHLILQAVIL